MTCPVCKKGSIRVMEESPPGGENPLFCLVYDTGKIRFLLFRVLLRSSEPPSEQTKKPLVFVGHPGVEKEIILEMRRVQQSRISGLNLRVPHGFVKGRRFERTGRTEGQQGKQKRKIGER